MRRLVFWFGLIGLFGLSSAQTVAWEKPIAPGLSYRMEVDSKTPRVIHALRWSLGAPGLTARSEVAQMRLFSAPGVEAKEGISSLMERSGAIAGINGDFFPASGDPLGAMVRDGQLLSRPFAGRATFGWGSATSAVGLLDWSGTVQIDGLESMTLQGFNEDVLPDRLVLFTEASAEARAPVPNVYFMVRMDTLGFAPTSNSRGQIMEIIRNQPSVKVPPGYAVLVQSGTSLGKILRADMGANVRIGMQTTGMDWSKIDNVIGGGPMLLKGGKESIDFLTASFSKSFAETRHPRTAVGRTAKGDLWFVAVDGRQPMSAGASLVEMAQIMAGYGCVDAANLDGGGSTTLAIFGQVLNRPSDGSERKVANGILFFGPKPVVVGAQVAIQGPATADAGSMIGYRLIGGDGNPLPDRNVLWSAMGSGGWIDQSGTLRTLDAGGPVVIRAYAQGLETSLTVTVKPKPVPAIPSKP